MDEERIGVVSSTTTTVALVGGEAVGVVLVVV